MGPFKSPGHGAKKQPVTVTVIPSIPKHCSVEDQIRLLLFDVILCCYIKGHGWKFNFIGSSNGLYFFVSIFVLLTKLFYLGQGGNYNIIFNIIILFNSKPQQLRRNVLLARENQVVWRPHQIFACARRNRPLSKEPKGLFIHRMKWSGLHSNHTYT